jgi:hypothetical protein
MKVLEVFGWPDRTPDVLIDYPVDAGVERPLAKGEKVFWVADPYTLPVEDRGAAAPADNFRPWLGIKALADTPENRKLVLASIGAAEVDGLQARLESNAYLHPRIGMGVTLYVKNVSDRLFAIEFQSLPVQWEVLDSEGKGVEPAKVSKADPKPDWFGYGPGGDSPGYTYGKSDVNRNGTLMVGACEWRLRPGRSPTHPLSKCATG